MPTPPPASLPDVPGETLASARLGALRASLVTLVVFLLATLFWQFQQESQQFEETQRQLNRAANTQLANHLSQSMALKARAGLAMLQAHAATAGTGADRQALLLRLRSVFPALRSLAWFDREGAVSADSEPDLGDQARLRDLLERNPQAPFHYAFSPEHGGLVYLLLRQSEEAGAARAWVLRLHLESLRNWLGDQHDGQHPWLLEDRLSQRVIASHRGQAVPASAPAAPLGADILAQSLLQSPLTGSDWQLHGLFNASKVRHELLAARSGKLLLFGLCTLLTLVALYRLLHEQRSLRAANAASQRELRQAASVLGAIEERVLVSDNQGRLLYLNPRAEQLFGLSNGAAHAWHLLELLPGLDPLLLHGNAFSGDLGPNLVSVLTNGASRQFAVSRSDISEDGKRSALVWVLRDVTEQERARQTLEQTRRRYQDIFEGTGTALCVLDLAELYQHLQANGLLEGATLQRWLQGQDQRLDQLCQLIRITEINQMARRLLEVDSTEQAWSNLVEHTPLSTEGFRVQLIRALAEGAGQLELERQITTPQGQERHLWLLLRLPEDPQDLQAVTLSISDITARKRSELSLVERERFWSDVVRAVPDTLYVQDMAERRVLFSNHHLGRQLGYSRTELKDMGEQFWEHILHPDDSEYYWRIRNLQQVIGEGVLLESLLRWRQKGGGWRWFSLREQALARDAGGRVSRLIGVTKDITEQIEASESLRASEQRYRLLAESISDVIFSTDSRLQLNYVSPSVETALGYRQDWVLANGLRGLVTNTQQLGGLFALLEQLRKALDAPRLLEELRRQFQPRVVVCDCLRADGRKIPVELRLVPMWNDNGHFEGLLGIGRDIDQQRRAEKGLRMAATVFEHSTAAILVTDPAGYIVQVNETFSRVTGFAPAQVLDQLPGLLTADRQQANHLNYVIGQLRQRGSWEGEVWLKRKSGEIFPAWVGITAVQDEEGDLVSYVCFFSDISERKASEERIHRLAYYDGLTHLPNRTLFQDRLHHALQQAERHQEWLVLMFLDLDRFKPINDSLGHAAGDRMLKEVALRLSACVGDEDTVARMGGDEFTLLLHAQASREAALHQAIHVAEQILASLARPFILEGREFFVTASVGIALSPQDGDELSQLMKNADTAMYHAKERGKNNFQFYQAEMNASALERLELESDLRHALEQDQFVLHYQPQFSGDGRRLTGAEALLRWQHPRRGLVPPDQFIPVLEELGLVVEVGDWVLREACRQLKCWHQEQIRVPKISVNLSARQFSEGDLHKRVAAVLEDSGLPAACLELELTESILMQDVSVALQTLTDLKRLGLCLAIDDFGTGYSSLNYLKQFPIDVLKIDRSFVDGLPDGEQDSQIARAIIAMAHSLNLAVIAEGVETQAQLDFLREHDCDQVQGYLLGRPIPATRFSAQFSGATLFMLS